jgi:hypothetical protein
MAFRLRTALLASLSIFCVALAAPAWAEGPFKTPEEEKQLAEILGSPLSDWSFGRRGGADFDHRFVKTSDGRTVLAGGPFATILDRKTPLEPDTELRITLRLHSATDQIVWYWLMLGHPEPAKYADSPYGLSFNLPAGAGQEWFYWTVRAAPGEKQALQGTYKSRGLPANRLTWPATVRARIEADHAAEPTLKERWMTIRVVLRNGSILYYLDDRLLRETSGKDVEIKGLLNMTVFDGVQLASIRTRKLPPAEDVRFETVPLNSDLNASEFAGRKLAAADLPKAGEPTVVDGVPFVLPTADAAGRNHIDLKPSWLPSGALEGSFDGWEGELARWAGATTRNPGRIQFRVRNGHYHKLHVLAAYSGEPDTTNTLTAQFFKSGAGHPIDFAAKVPADPANAANATGPLKLTHVTIPLEPEGLSAFANQAWLDFELTKALRTYRSFPDPIYYGKHAAGLPSGVHVFAVTLEKPETEIELVPKRFAHIWTAPERPIYTVKLKNNTAAEQKLELQAEMNGRLHPPVPVTVPAQGTASADLQLAMTAADWAKLSDTPDTALKDRPNRLDPADYGLFRFQVRVTGPNGKWASETKRFAWLHPDTRERGGWEEGKGPIFGFWDWNGGHDTPSGMDRLSTMTAAGAESMMHSLETGADTKTPFLAPEEREFCEKHGYQTFFLAYQLSMGKHSLGGKDWDPKKPAEMEKALIDWLKSRPESKATKLNKPEQAIFFAEPIVGPISYMSLPHLYGEPEYQMTDAEKALYQNYHDQFVFAAKAIKKEWPGTKCLFPWGLPLFPVPFLKSEEARNLMDGPCLDVICFERLPEMQLHQVTFSSQLWQLKQEWLRAGKEWPKFTALEGPAISPATTGALSLQQEADHTVRAHLVLAAYGTTRHLGCPAAFSCAGSWGETHYGGGLCERQPLLSPKPAYVSYATMTRQLNRMNFVKPLATGSNTVLGLQFKHYKTGELLHVFWTLRGKRPMTIAVDADKPIEVFDWQDNGERSNGSFTVTTSPCYVRGLTADPKITLGEPDHAGDDPIAQHTQLLGNLGDGTWTISEERDLDYEESHPEFVRRFPGKFSVASADAPKPAGGKALAVHLEKQEKERRVMPFYTTLVPAKPITLAGKPANLGLWAKAASDWGRVVYVMTDAQGEKWISVGRKGEWNVDDVHCWSAFNYDGWRYLKFELPGNAPYDLYREAGTSFWGNYGAGDAIVDYPLTLEKVIVERRTHVIAGTELMPAGPADVLLGDLKAEYDTAEDMTDEAVRQSRLRMPMPANPPSLENPIVKQTETGVAPPTRITKVATPPQENTGRSALVDFDPVEGAKSYNIWVSNYPDGRGAILMGSNWPKSGQLLTGLVANLDLYLFVTYTDKDGKPSKPSAAFPIRLKDMFPMK